MWGRKPFPANNGGLSGVLFFSRCAAFPCLRDPLLSMAHAKLKTVQPKDRCTETVHDQTHAAAQWRQDRRRWIACTERPRALLSLRSWVILGGDPRISGFRPAHPFAAVVPLRRFVVAPLLCCPHRTPRFAMFLPPAQLALTNNFGTLPAAPVMTSTSVSVSTVSHYECRTDHASTLLSNLYLRSQHARA